MIASHMTWSEDSRLSSHGSFCVVDHQSLYLRGGGTPRGKPSIFPTGKLEQSQWVCVCVCVCIIHRPKALCNLWMSCRFFFKTRSHHSLTQFVSAEWVSLIRYVTQRQKLAIKLSFNITGMRGIYSCIIFPYTILPVRSFYHSLRAAGMMCKPLFKLSNKTSRTTNCWWIRITRWVV